MDGFEKRESLGPRYWSYWQDERWDKVRELRLSGKNAEANRLVSKIRQDWGME